MAFPEKLLNPDEEVVLDLRPHWSFFARPAAIFVLALAFLIAMALIARASWVDNAAFNSAIVIIGLVVTVIAGAALAKRLLDWRSINMVITSERMVVREGLVAKSGIEIPLERINTVFFEQGLFQRLIGSGNLSVESAGENGRQDFANVWRPNRVQQVIYQAKEMAEEQDHRDAAEAIAQAHRQAAAPSAAPAAVPAASIPEQIAQLDELRMRGVITDAEFQAKKTELLSRM